MQTSIWIRKPSKRCSCRIFTSLNLVRVFIYLKFLLLPNVANGVLTAPWVMTALADRFLLIASLLPKRYTAALGVNNQLSRLLFYTLGHVQ